MVLNRNSQLIEGSFDISAKIQRGSKEELFYQKTRSTTNLQNAMLELVILERLTHNLVSNMDKLDDKTEV